MISLWYHSLCEQKPQRFRPSTPDGARTLRGVFPLSAGR
jgi:hypothetical protein